MLFVFSLIQFFKSIARDLASFKTSTVHSNLHQLKKFSSEINRPPFLFYTTAIVFSTIRFLLSSTKLFCFCTPTYHPSFISGAQVEKKLLYRRKEWLWIRCRIMKCERDFRWRNV